MKHKSNALQDVYLIQTHFKLEKFEYYESLMKQVYKELELKHCMLEEMQSRIEALEKDAARLDWLEESDEGHGFCHTEFGQYRHYAYKGTVRQAIDAAMKSEKGGV